MILPSKLLIEINERGISEEELAQQVMCFVKGSQPVELTKAATIDDGICKVNNLEGNKYANLYNDRQAELTIYKFIPASGMATRMFKKLLEFLNTKKSNPSSTYFFNNLHKFPFYKDVVIEFHNQHKSIKKLDTLANKLLFLDFLLNEKGLSYKNTPKGLIKFHQYDIYNKSAVQEQIDESIEYAIGKDNIVHLHFTVTPAYRDRFENHVRRYIETNLDDYVKFKIEFSIQKPNTDTLAVNQDNSPYNDKNGNYLFRAGGHGALIENLNDINADIVFIKNVDNVCHQNHKEETVHYKQILAGVLLNTQDQIFNYLQLLKKNKVNLEEVINFVQKRFYVELCKEKTTAQELFELLNRPIRVCGMILNQGDVGGGPFWVKDEKGKSSLQIIESAQVNIENNEQKDIFLNATHFNPVDIVCGIKDFEGNKFNLNEYVDPETYFITDKSVDGYSIKGLEKPGLWNGAMAKWLNIFIEVPLDTFNPVKSVTDLLNPMHQA